MQKDFFLSATTPNSRRTCMTDFLQLGFETCGNATIIAYEAGKPVVVTDPWTEGQQYFGSWVLPYQFTTEQLSAIRACPYVWLSHGHPDHLNFPSLDHLRHATLLLPEHQGDRIVNDLTGLGFTVRRVKTGVPVKLTDNIEILTYPDWNQDSACLLLLGRDCAVLNLNDGGAWASKPRMRAILNSRKRRFVLALNNYGDADMMNVFTESGDFVVPPAAQKPLLGQRYAALLKEWNATHTAVFSCSHAYNRKDSEWAVKYETPLEAHGQGFDSQAGEFIPGYFSYDARADHWELSAMKSRPRAFLDPAEFGDNWADQLDAGEREEVTGYFQKFGHLHKTFGFVNARIGGKDHRVSLRGPKEQGITFECPKNSFMSAIRYEIFDDLLIGNFMKTTLHGGRRSLYPDFSPYVGKYGDSGKAFSDRDLKNYFAYYRGLYGLDYWLSMIEFQSVSRLRPMLRDTPFFSAGKKAYEFLRRFR
jgi:hypothetical protein